MNDIANTAYNTAKTWVQAHPLTKETSNGIIERSAFHAVLDILGDRLTKDETDAVIALWVQATVAERNQGWDNGWNSAAKAYRTEVAA